ncbi:MAG: T9SS type A sorting domain-containing protein [Chitinophagales bacterium]|nr:T9SS type A sorting domain-containing protein [Chitinophagales bacterium]
MMLDTDIKEDKDGYYVIAGTASVGGNQVPTDAHLDGDYWVFRIKSDGYFDADYSKVFYGDNPIGGNDYARSVVVDCYSGDYFVSGWCKSCDPNDGDEPQVLLIRVPFNDFISSVSQPYGNIDQYHLYDYGSNNIIQPHDITFGVCDANDGFFSLGTQHPNIFGLGCFGTTHDFLGIKTDDALAEDANFIDGCDDNTSGGLAYGGRKGDNGWSTVQTCEGYLIVGNTKSNNLDLTCTYPTYPADCQVTCNHYNCNPIAYTEDMWVAKISSSTGEFIWDESIGTSGNDGAYSIARADDNTFLIAGYATNATNNDFQVVKFQLAECPPPYNLTAVVEYCQIKFTWEGLACDQSYELQYRKIGGLWITVNTTDPIYLTPTLSYGPYQFKVKTQCSPDVYSDGYVVYGSSIIVPLSCLKLADEDFDLSKYLLSISPNPSDGSFDISLQLAQQTTNELATIYILDQVGKIVSTTHGTIAENGVMEIKMSTGNLPSGFYWVKIIHQGKSYQTKLVLQKE